MNSLKNILFFIFVRKVKKINYFLSVRILISTIAREQIVNKTFVLVPRRLYSNFQFEKMPEIWKKSDCYLSKYWRGVVNIMKFGTLVCIIKLHFCGNFQLLSSNSLLKNKLLNHLHLQKLFRVGRPENLIQLKFLFSTYLCLEMTETYQTWLISVCLSGF